MGDPSASVAEVQALQNGCGGGSPPTGTCNSSPDISTMRSCDPFTQPYAASFFQQGRDGVSKRLAKVAPDRPWQRRRSGQERWAAGARDFG